MDRKCFERQKRKSKCASQLLVITPVPFPAPPLSPLRCGWWLEGGGAGVLYAVKGRDNKLKTGGVRGVRGRVCEGGREKTVRRMSPRERKINIS